jgi:hypothetical protein
MTDVGWAKRSVPITTSGSFQIKRVGMALRAYAHSALASLTKKIRSLSGENLLLLLEAWLEILL